MDSFLTVSKASSNRALDMPASYVSTLRDGEEIFVESYGRKFVWDSTFPSGTSIVDGESFRPASWSANGAFVADLRGEEKFWRQSAWFVNTSGDDENDGLTSATPLKTDAEIQRRWGLRPRIAVPVTITYAQSPAGFTNYALVIASGGSVTFVGTPTVSKAGTIISAVQTQVRIAGAEAAWAITGTGLGASDVGKLAVITASGTPANVGAYAAILKDETGGKVRVSPFGTYAATGTFTQATPQIGDVIEVRDLSATTLNVGEIELHVEYNSAAQASPARQVVIFDSAKLDGNSATLIGFIHGPRSAVHFARSEVSNMVITAGNARFCGGLVTGTSGIGVRAVATATFPQTGFLNTILQTSHGGASTLQADTYFQNSTLSISRGGTSNTQGVAVFDRASSDSAISVSGGGFCIQTGAVPDWGTNNTGHGVKVQSAGAYTYTTKPQINSGLGAGREALVGGTDKLYSAIPYFEVTNGAALVLSA